MDSHRRIAMPLSALAATAALLLAAPASGAATPGGQTSADETRAAATAGAPTADAARRRIPRRAIASRRRGVRRIAGVRVGPLTEPDAIPTFADVRRKLGRPRSLRGRKTESCHARWHGGLEMTFTTFGVPGACAKRPLQAATLTKRRWRVRVGRRVYRIGMHRRRLPRNAEHIDDWGGGGFVLADMPFAGDRTPTVLAHVTKKRIDRFYLWVGGGGD